MTDPGLSRDAIRLAARAAGLADHADALAASALLGARVLPHYVEGAESLDEVRAAAGAPVGTTKVGGLPDLPAENEWPRGEWGPMTFCMQVRTGELGPLADELGLQAGRLLSFFADRDPDSSDATAGAVLVSDVAAVTRQALPDDVHEDFEPAYDFPYTEAWAEVRLTLTVPAYERAAAEIGAPLDQDRWERFEVAVLRAQGLAPRDHIRGGRSQILGHAGGAQTDPILSAIAQGTFDQADAQRDGWRLLAVFSSEEPLWIDIADAGSFYFVVPAADCRFGRFEQVRVVMDCG